MNRKIQIAVLALVVAATGILAVPTTSAQNSEVSFDIVVQWLNIKGLTKYNNVADFRKDDLITRGESSKFYTQFGKLFQLEKTYTACDFSDIAGYDSSLTPFIAEACSFGLIKGSQGKFNPTGNLSEIEAATIISRAISGFKDETKEPWYTDYYTHAKQLGLITTETMNSANTTSITREKLGRWMFVADKARDIGEGGPNVWVSLKMVWKDGSETDLSGKIQVDIDQQGPESEADMVKGILKYDTDLVNTAISQGQQVVLFFSASRCPLCQALDADLEAKVNDIPDTLAIFSVDYDDEKDLVREYQVTSQHTLIYLDNKGQPLYSNVKQEITLEEMIEVIVTANGTINN